jgi:hypothetical protein
VHRKATVSVAAQIIHAPQTATFAKAVSTTATAAVVSPHVVTVVIQPLAAISHRVVTLPHVKNLPHVVTSLLVKTSPHVRIAVILRLVATVQNAVTLLHVKISPLAVTLPHVVTLLIVNQRSLSLASPSQRLLNQQQNQAMAAKCLCHVIWQKHALFALSNF